MLTLLALIGTSWRIGIVAVFDVMSLVFVILMPFIAPTEWRRTLWRVRHLPLVIALLLFGVTTSFFQTGDQSEHIFRSINLIVSVATMWLFSAYAGELPLMKSLLTLLAVLTVGSASVVLGGASHGPIQVGEISRQIGWMEHSGEAGYVAAFGVILGAWLWIGMRSKVAIIAIIINLISIRYSASMTSVASVGVGLIVMSYMYRKIIPTIGILSGIVGAIIFIPGISDSLLIRRVVDAFFAGSDYDTVDSRVTQINDTAGLIFENIVTLFTGRGFAPTEISGVGGLDIHNTLLASIYHFGMFGAASYVIMFVYLLRPIFLNGLNRSDRALSLGMWVVFGAAILSSPGLNRRTLWVPMILITVTLLQEKSRRLQAKPSSRQMEAMITQERISN
ncbi:MAG: hypothetical protein Q8L16_12305 [Hydrogenophaga sp.]|nr:hypothetical protein [Hydrogenophaga sp.]